MIRTRHIIVTLPDVTGEEADIAISEIENYLADTVVAKPRVERAFEGESFSRHVRTKASTGLVFISVWLGEPAQRLGTDEARNLAALLLRAADEAEGGAS